jgi:hypothetical protein
VFRPFWLEAEEAQIFKIVNTTPFTRQWLARANLCFEHGVGAGIQQCGWSPLQDVIYHTS